MLIPNGGKLLNSIGTTNSSPAAAFIFPITIFIQYIGVAVGVPFIVGVAPGVAVAVGVTVVPVALGVTVAVGVTVVPVALGVAVTVGVTSPTVMLPSVNSTPIGVISS